MDYEKEKAEAYQRYYEEALGEPLDWVRHDSNARTDDALEALRDELGFDGYGRWWLLVELLSARKGHGYDIGRAHGWEHLARDMEWEVEPTKTFVAWLLDHGLLSRESFEAFDMVRSERIMRNAHEYAEGVAAKRLGGWAKARRARA